MTIGQQYAPEKVRTGPRRASGPAAARHPLGPIGAPTNTTDQEEESSNA